MGFIHHPCFSLVKWKIWGNLSSKLDLKSVLAIAGNFLGEERCYWQRPVDYRYMVFFFFGSKYGVDFQIKPHRLVAA